MYKKELNKDDFEIVKIERKEGVFKTETGTEIPFKNYYIDIKRKDNPLVMRSKLDKVFRPYIEDDTSDGEEIAVNFGSSEEDYEN